MENGHCFMIATEAVNNHIVTTLSSLLCQNKLSRSVKGLSKVSEMTTCLFDDQAKALIRTPTECPNEVRHFEYSVSEHATLHFTLGNVYATVMQFNNSADSYQRAIDIRPKYLAAKGVLSPLFCFALRYCILLRSG